MLSVFVLDVRRFLIGLQIVITIRQAQSALVNVGSHLSAILEILSRPGDEENIDAHRMQAADVVLQCFLIFDFRNAIKLRRQRFKSVSFYLRFIHAGCVVVADFLFAAALRGLRVFCRCFQNLMQHVAVAFIEQVRHSPT